MIDDRLFDDLKTEVRRALVADVGEHFKALIHQGIDADPVLHVGSLKDRFRHGIKDRLTAYGMALDVLQEFRSAPRKSGDGIAA